MNQRFLVNKAIALLSFGQTQVVVSFRFNVQTIFFVFFILQVSQREIKNSVIFKILFKYLVPSIVSCCSSALSNIASVSLTFEFNIIQIQLQQYDHE